MINTDPIILVFFIVGAKIHYLIGLSYNPYSNKFKMRFQIFLFFPFKYS
jgi:hypothetical protein